MPLRGLYCDMVGSVTDALQNGDAGVVVLNGTPTVRLSNSTVVNNGIGIQLVSGTVASYVNNRIAGNGSGNTPSAGATTVGGVIFAGARPA